MDTEGMQMLFYRDDRGGCPEWSETLAALDLRASTAEASKRTAALVCRMVELAEETGIAGNVWQQWLTYILMISENPFTMACERRRIPADATVRKLALADLEVFRELFASDFAGLEVGTGRTRLAGMTEYVPAETEPCVTKAGAQISGLAGRLARAGSTEAFADILTDYYAEYGAGIYGLYRAFRVDEAADAGSVRTAPLLVPVRESGDVTFDDLVGYESQKRTLRDNTEAFVSGRHANNVLLYGDSGTGKSTSVHALMHEYYGRGLRLVEISRQSRRLLPQVLSEIKKRNYRFIIFLDDLSFEENESDYKELKAMLEGALETRSDQVLIYATSNRRHLIRETWRDRSDMEYEQDVHHSDTMEEKLSLAARFGVTIYYGKPEPAEYLNIVKELAARQGIALAGRELEDAARKWELRHGGMTGRAASQLVTWLRGQEQ